MKFDYEFRTSSNEIRQGSIRASSREEVYQKLKGRGVRPSRVVASPGLANGILGVLNRYSRALMVCIISCGVVCVLALVRRRTPTDDFLESPTRRQVVGDVALIEKGIRSGWSDVFKDQGDRFFAGYAIPGRKPAFSNPGENIILSSLNSFCEISQNDGLESRQIKAMVNGVKLEMRLFLKQGGSVAQYLRLLNERQEAEIGCYTRAREEILKLSESEMNDEELERVWDQRNDDLRQMGVCTIPFPSRGGE